jgi:menaquinone-9 beta-reductase
MFDTDVFILGGGPAGLAAGIAARREGFRVLVADAARPPIDKPCGEGLMPDALAAAARLEIAIPDRLGYVFNGIRFVGENCSVDGRFPMGHGLGVRRTALHPVLVEAASRAGVDLSWGVPVTRLEDEHTVRLGSSPVRARWIVGADGGQSSLRRWGGLEVFRRETRRFGFRRHYGVAPWSSSMEIHWGHGCQFYVTPVAAGEICLVLMSRDAHLRIDQALPYFPKLEARLVKATILNHERGSLASTGRLKRVARGNVALIGDASGTVDAITGEGLCLAFSQAVALASALAAGDLRLYDRAHRRLARRPVFMADFMLLLDRWPWLRERVLPAFAERPALFSNLLAMHVGKLNLARFVAAAATLGWEVVTG